MSLHRIRGINWTSLSFSRQVLPWTSKTCPSLIDTPPASSPHLASSAAASKSTSPHRQTQCTPEPPAEKKIPEPCMHNRHPLALASHQPSLLHRHLAHQIAACSWHAQVFHVALVTVRRAPSSPRCRALRRYSEIGDSLSLGAEEIHGCDLRRMTSRGAKLRHPGQKVIRSSTMSCVTTRTDTERRHRVNCTVLEKNVPRKT
jgi:hypothetical protein